MILIKVFMLFISLIFVCYRVGLLVNKVTKKNNYFSILLLGFVSITCVLQIIYIPLILLHVSFNFVLYLTLVVILIMVILSFVANKFTEEKKLLKYNYTKLKTMKKENLAIFVILIVIVITQATTSSLLFNENADDAFYVSLVEQNKTSEKIYTQAPSLGIDNTTFLSRYMVSGHELALSVVSKVFAIPSTTLCHTVIPFIMIIFSYMAYYVLARKFFNNEKSQIFILLLSIMFLFSGFTTRFRGIILLSRMWQGKEIFLNIVLTLILSNLITLNKYNEKRNLISLVVLNFSAVFFTNTATFLVFFVYFGFGIVELIKRNWKMFIKLILVLIPIAIYAILYLLVSENILGSASRYQELNVINIIKNYFGTGYYWILYIISIFIIAIKGNKRARKYFLLVPIIYSLTIYNPLFTNIVIKYFTGSEVFWRLFWLLPVEFSIVYSFVLIITLMSKKIYKLLVLIVEIALLVIMGKFAYSEENGFVKAENSNKIPETIIAQTQYILDKQNETNPQEIATVMALPEPLHSATMRQMTSKINIFWSRDHYMNELFSREEVEEMEKIRSIYRNQVPSISQIEFNEIRNKYKVNWIIVLYNNLDIIQYLEQTDPISETLIDGYMLYQY